MFSSLLRFLVSVNGMMSWLFCAQNEGSPRLQYSGALPSITFYMRPSLLTLNI